MKSLVSRFESLRSERGNVLIGALLVLLVLTAMGTTYVAMTRTETQIAGHEQRHVQSMYNAEAGVGEALARMSASSDSAIYFGEDPFMPPTPGWGRYLVLTAGNSVKDPQTAATETDGVDNDGDGQVDEGGERYPEVLTVQSATNAVKYPWVKVRYKMNGANQVILFGDHDNDPSTAPVPNLVRGMPILVVSSEGAQGSADRRIQVEAVKMPFMTPRAAIYTESDNFNFNGTQFLVSGKDWDPATGDSVIGNPEVPGIATTQTPVNITDALHANQLNNVEGQGAEPAVSSSPYDYDLEAMVDTYSRMADITYAGGTISNSNSPDWGGVDDYHIVNVTGDLHISGSLTGGGLLLLNGDLTVSGSFTWYGMIINLGNIDFTGGGSEIHIYGAVMSTGGLNSNVVGGNADVLFSSIALTKLTSFNPYRVSSWTELP